MRVTYDPAKRAKTFEGRGLDFDDAAVVFAGTTFEVEDTRRDYGETRIICYGCLQGRLVVIGYTPRGGDRHVFSMRKANAREEALIAPLLAI
ncbi:MAG TPA: BrnT family toxin [Steroidobacteraceae bacterium]|nr:BrnT family toxin [Acidobacteriota bacterium]MBP7614779.1 BrnT family toxin [Steroidobacteraceae bacterium]HQW10027.1 BrnT family toxin [Steroidobacteraceae bacterium]HQX46309.1 BrnT family toxin [Steroidobacteraceae bacterium]HQZ79247.1 BrnT family toxin [Steroidobacteraceae bacterium]